MKWFLASVLGLVMAGCSKGGDSAPAAPPFDAGESEAPSSSAVDLISFAEGTQWVYDLEASIQTKEGAQNRTGEFTIRVDEATTDDEGTTATVTTVDSKVTDKADPSVKVTLSWRIGPDGLVQLAGNDLKAKFEPPMPLIPATLKTDDKISWSGTGPRLDGTVGKFDLAITVQGFEETDTAMGRMKAWDIVTVAAWMDKGQQVRAKTTSWWSPKVGLVRMIREIDAPEYGLSTFLRLKSHTVKQ